MADKALLTGINNYKSIGDLRGCINDTLQVERLLIDEFGFAASSVHRLEDSKVNKKELLKQWRWLVSGTKPGDRIVFHFSGHGSYTVDENGDESDGVDELLCLHDMDWNDPGSYLLDDELRNWIKEFPEGVHLTVLMDSCHSGTGTRMVAPPAGGVRDVSMQSASLVDVEASLRRSRKGAAVAATNAAGLMAAIKEILPESAEQLGAASVVARFASPPPDVIRRLNDRGRRSTFSPERSSMDLSRAEDDMNHVLWSGSQSDQTSADAHIDGDFHGAFTWYFCHAIQKLGKQPECSAVISKLRDELSQSGFEQIPQLEPAATSGAVFGGAAATGSTLLDHSPSKPGTHDDDCGCGGSVASKPGPSGDQWERIAASLESLVAQLVASQRQPVDSRDGRPRSLVYVHGICLHEAGYSDNWWNALSPHLAADLRTQLAHNRHEALWSRHVTAVDRSLRSVLTPNEDLERQRLRDQLQEVLQERAAFEVATAIRSNAATGDGEEATRSLDHPPESISRAAFGIPGLDCVDDFTKYLVSDQIRAAVINEFTKVIRPLLNAGHAVDVISHSWGTVVAYEGLRSLEGANFSGRVPNFFTVGSALAISFIRNRLRPSDGRKPSMCDRWINLDAKGDLVGGSLQAVSLAVNSEFLELEPTGCAPIARFIQLYQPACAHSSYFHANNRIVNRDIFAAFMQR